MKRSFSKYIRILLLTLLMLVSSTALKAETVSQKEASRLAEAFFNTSAGQVMGKPKLVYNGKNLTTNRLFSPFYVYNHPKGGFVIIAADNKAMPVLGYSLKETFSPDNIDDATKELLSEYAKDIEYIRYDSRLPEEAIGAWTDIPAYLHSLLFDTPDYDVATLDDHDQWRMRAQATEFPGVAALKKAAQTEEEDDEDIALEDEETPFEFYDSFVAETRAAEEQRLRAFDEKLRPTEPVLRWIGGGHYELWLPEDVSMVRIYNLAGRMVRELTYRNTDTAVFNIDSEPTGFYFVLANGTSGRPYGLKIYK